MMPMIARISSRWMRPPATCSEKPSNHNTKRTTTTVQIKLAMKNLPDSRCVLSDSVAIMLPQGDVGVNLGRGDPDPGPVTALSSRVRPDAGNRVRVEIEGGFGSEAGVCDRA